MKDIYVKRRADLATWMASQGLAACVFHDAEGMRDLSLRYYTGHPSDGMLIVRVDGFSVLSPWDEHLAKKMAHCDAVIPFTLFVRNEFEAVREILDRLDVKAPARIAIPESTSYPDFLKYVNELSGYDVLCREDSFHRQTKLFRQQKDEDEIKCTRKACDITNRIIEKLEEKLKNNELKTEYDVAKFIEGEALLNDCEGLGFETLAASSKRSFAIHCFPSYTNAEFPSKGLNILDFGVKYKGYTSDVTLTIVKGELNPKQKMLLDSVEQAYKEALPYYKAESSIKDAASVVDNFFYSRNFNMPHSLGHGVGLETHEMPVINTKVKDDRVFKKGMIVTLEPGLYDPKLGGARFENTLLITEDGNEELTKSKIIYL